MTEHRAEWKKAPDFAEVAEALEVTTTAIFAALNPQANEVDVFYSPDLENEPERIFFVKLRRDAYGVLGLASVPAEQIGMWDQMKEGLDRHMRETFGDPPGEE